MTPRTKRIWWRLFITIVAAGLNGFAYFLAIVAADIDIKPISLIIGITGALATAAAVWFQAERNPDAKFAKHLEDVVEMQAKEYLGKLAPYLSTNTANPYIHFCKNTVVEIYSREGLFGRTTQEFASSYDGKIRKKYHANQGLSGQALARNEGRWLDFQKPDRDILRELKIRPLQVVRFPQLDYKFGLGIPIPDTDESDRISSVFVIYTDTVIPEQYIKPFVTFITPHLEDLAAIMHRLYETGT